MLEVMSVLIMTYLSRVTSVSSDELLRQLGVQDRFCMHCKCGIWCAVYCWFIILYLHC